MSDNVQKTPLHAAHIAANAKMGAFAGYDMPLYYPLGVMKEHEWTRTHCGLFDVSHMGQALIEGENVGVFLERLTPSAFQTLKQNAARYTVLTNAEGGIIDDLIITRLSENKYFMVLNAGCKEKDIAWIKQSLPANIQFTPLPEKALVAIQGPQAEQVIRESCGIDLSVLGYMKLTEAVIEGETVFISRLGYTGEDGFEISVSDKKAETVWNKLAAHSAAQPVGLAARDSLRLEMGYCLYSHDIDETTSPVEADLTWTFRKNNFEFIGCERIKRELAEGAKRKRVGFRLLEKGVAREHCKVQDVNGRKVGEITSGGFSPTLQMGLGQIYVEAPASTVGTKINILVRDKLVAAEVAAMPFLQPKTKTTVKAA
ncbi:MAG: glycine cleavage system aminomethyltransferase GcvT [Alphaproteobacteria bacterium]|nr:glycine cleavage system aminomethyltransferase GcvT [Alphaproteobacteria bacterium]